MLEDRFQDFLETCRGQSDFNRRNYTRRLKSFLEEHGGKPPADVTPADVNAWHRDLQARDLAPATLAGYRQALKALFNYCVTVGDIDRSPAAHLAIGSFATSRDDLVPPEDDVQAVTNLAFEWLRSEKPSHVRDGLIWLLSLQSGPRLGEILNLRLADVRAALRAGPDSLGVYRVQSTGKTIKTGRVRIRFAGEVVDGFKKWLALRPDTTAPQCFVTTQPAGRRPAGASPYRALTRSAATHIYQRICEAAGVQPPILSHALRHRLGDQTTRQYGPKVAAILLNHKDWQNATTAIAFYHHPDEGDASRAVLSGGIRADLEPVELRDMRRLFGLE